MIIIDVTSDYLHAKYNKGEILYKKIADHQLSYIYIAIQDSLRSSNTRIYYVLYHYVF